MSTAARAVGMCITRRTAVISVVRPEPLRLTALATVSWPTGLWPSEAGTAVSGAAMSTARRSLVRVRRQLGLPKWCAVSVVTDQHVLPLSATLLARAGLPQGWTVAPDLA